MILAGLLAVLPGLLDAERACEPDSARYLALGRRLLARGCFCNDDGRPHATTPPVYPAIAALAAIGVPERGARGDSALRGVPATGRGEVGGRASADCQATRAAARAALLLLQVLVFLASVDLLRRLCRGCGLSVPASRRVALLYGLSPLPLIYVGRILSETVFVALLLAGLYLLLVAPAAPTHGRAGWLRPTLAGALLGLATLTRILLAPWFLLWPLLALSLPRWRRRLLFASLGVALVLAPWLARNWSAFGRPGLTAAGGTNALEYAAALIAPAEQRAAALREERGPAPLENPYAESDAQARVAARIIAERPGAFLLQAARTFPALLVPPLPGLLQSADAPLDSEGISRSLRDQGPGAALREILRRLRAAPPAARLLTAVLALWDLALLAAALIGFGYAIAGRPRAPSDRAKMLWLLLGSLALILVAMSVGAWHPRFRVPLTPAIALLTYLFAVRFLRPRRPRPASPRRRGRSPASR